jgi:DNA-binding NarL/FixJ family response regulator
MSGAGPRPITVLIVDDHPVVRDGIRGMLADEPDIVVVGEAADGEHAIAALALRPADVVLMDLRMPGMGGAAATAALREGGSPAHVLVLTTYDGDRDVLPAIEAGATGYLLKDAPRADLIAGIRAAHAGRPVLSDAIAGVLMNRLGGPAREPIEEISARELEVLRLVAAGETNRSAARALLISEATVKTHLLHLYAKLGVRDRASAVAAAYQRGLLS